MLHAPELRAFERTYRDEGPFVAAVLGRLAVPSEAVHDAVQDVFVAAYRRWPDFDDTRPVRPWLTAFAHRVAFRYRRSQARRDRKRAALRHVHVVTERSSAERADARAFLRRFLAQLDDGHRHVFMLSELEGRTAPEIAKVVGISTEAVYGRVRRVRKRLHRALMDDAREPDAAAASVLPPFGALLPHLGFGAAASGLGSSLAAIKAISAMLVVSAAAVVGVVVLTPEVEPAPVVAEVPTSDVRASSPSPAPNPAPAPPVGATPTPQAMPAATARPRRAASSPEVETSSLDDEAALLRAAKRAQVAGRLEDALTQLDVHARRFPDGQLADGRRRARIRVLCDLGRTAQARGEAKLLAGRSPGDPLAIQALEICTAPIRSSARPEKPKVKP
ncbi:MAG: RNA polymerase sigma factor [Nannocystaceae bacterium]|nr:sigma-70 family RNA polymerase sigma factor [bacterium]